jgi:hypothetical protein
LGADQQQGHPRSGQRLLNFFEPFVAGLDARIVPPFEAMEAFQRLEMDAQVLQPAGVMLAVADE